MSSNLYAIGDIHGSLESLERLLEKINPDLPKDRLVFVGDYIDRGPQSKAVVDYIIRLQNLAPPGQIVCLKGNHEAMFLDFLAGGPAEMFLFNGGMATLEDYWADDWADREGLALPPDHEQFYRDLQLYYETPDYIFVHARAQARRGAYGAAGRGPVVDPGRIHHFSGGFWPPGHFWTYAFQAAAAHAQ